MNSKKPFEQIDFVKFIFAAIIILLLPALFTQTDKTIFDFSDSGQIGDTIGGITAPFVGLLSAYLIYRAFIAQVQANEIQAKNNQIQSQNNEFGIALKLIDDLESKINNPNNLYEFEAGEGTTRQVSGANFYEIVRFWNGMRSYKKHYTELIVRMIKQINYFKKFVDRSKNLTEYDKILLFEKASLAFGSKLFPPFEILLLTETDQANEEDKQFYAYCRKFHDTTLQDFLFHSIDINDF